MTGPAARGAALLSTIDRTATSLARAGAGWGTHAVALGGAAGMFAIGALRDLRVWQGGSPVTHALWAISGALAYGAIAVALAWRRDARPSFAGLERVLRGLNPKLTFLLALPLIQGVARTHEGKQPLTVLLLSSLAALAVGISAYHWASRKNEPSRDSSSDPNAAPDPRPDDSVAAASERGRRRRIAWALGSVFVTYSALMTWLSWNNLWGFNMGRSDMGYYVNIFRQSSLGIPLGMSLAKSGTHLSGHFDPILVLLSPLYLIHPDAETLLLLQSVWLGSGVFPLYLLARHFGNGRGSSLLLTVCYALYPALHGINLFDFHSLALCVPVILWLLLFLEQGKARHFFITFVVLLLVREDMALVASVLGFYALISGHPHGRRWGWIVIGTSLLWLVIVKGFIMTRSDLLMAHDTTTLDGTGKRPKVSGYAHFFSDLVPPGGNTGTLVATLIGNPVYVLQTLLKEAKFVYALQLLLPLSLLPLFAKRGKVLLLYGFAFTLLASRPFLHSVNFHYSAVLVPFLFPLVALALGDLRRARVLSWLPLDRRRLAVALLATTVTSTALASWQFGGFVPNRAFRGGFRPLERNPTALERDLGRWLREFCARVPRETVVAANSRLLPHLGRCKSIVLAEDRKRADVLVFRKSSAELTSSVNRDVKRGLLIEQERYRTLTVYRTAYEKTKGKKKTDSKGKRAPQKSAPRKSEPRKDAPTQRDPRGTAKPESERPAPDEAGDPGPYTKEED